MQELVNLYIDGLPFCRCSSLPIELRKLARQEGITITCTLYKDEGLQAASFLCKHGYNAYIREGEDRQALCEPAFIGDYYEADEEPSYNSDERWYKE